MLRHDDAESLLPLPLSGVLYGVGAHDPLTFLATAATLFAAATLACWLPARRATRLDPCMTLREG